MSKKLRVIFRRNKITSLEEIKHLTHLRNLQVLWLSENPVAKEKNYRMFCVKNLPTLIKLDDKNITPEERQMAKGFDFNGTFSE